MQAHILVCFLVLALWRTLEQWMQAKGLGTCARQLIKEIAGTQSVDVIAPVRRAGVTDELRLRVVTTQSLPPPNCSATLACACPRFQFNRRCSAENRGTKAQTAHWQ